jgi:hypothetical protein
MLRATPPYITLTLLPLRLRPSSRELREAEAN